MASPYQMVPIAYSEQVGRGAILMFLRRGPRGRARQKSTPKKDLTDRFSQAWEETG